MPRTGTHPHSSTSPGAADSCSFSACATVTCVLAIEDRTKLEKEVTLGPEVQCKRSFLDLVEAEFGVAPLGDDCVIEIPALGKLEDIGSLDDGDTVEITGRLAVAVTTSPSGFVHVSARLLL